MRISHFGLLMFSTALALSCALPCGAQPVQSTSSTVIFRTGSKTFVLPCQGDSHLNQCIDGMKALSSKDKQMLKLNIPKMHVELMQSLSRMQDRSAKCFAMKVYQFPRGYPDKNATAEPSVSDCTSAARVKEQTIRVSGQ